MPRFYCSVVFFASMALCSCCEADEVASIPDLSTPYLGVEVSTKEEVLQGRKTRNKPRDGVYVTYVDPQSPCLVTVPILSATDVISRVNGKTVGSVEEFHAAIKEVDASGRISFEVGDALTLKGPTRDLSWKAGKKYFVSPIPLGKWAMQSTVATEDKLLDEWYACPLVPHDALSEYAVYLRFQVKDNKPCELRWRIDYIAGRWNHSQTVTVKVGDHLYPFQPDRIEKVISPGGQAIFETIDMPVDPISAEMLRDLAFSSHEAVAMFDGLQKDKRPIPRASRKSLSTTLLAFLERGGELPRK